MNATKRINVNFSSLVGLKAELLRKQTEVNASKLRNETAARAAPKLRKKSKRPKKETNDNDKSEKLTDVDEINAHKKSKLMLEAKTRMYDRLKKSKNNNENFLVDFTNKSDESEEESDKEDLIDNIYLDEDEDGWVEYKDCFGRTRKCLREDLPVMQKKDDMVKDQIMNRRNHVLRDEIVDQPPTVEEKEPEIEIMRRKWEEQTRKLADKANIHYQDILFDEARAHGVGYYGFSHDEEQRTKQQENLASLRKDTERKQKEMKELREMRDRMEQNRLKAARIRQRIRAGLPAEPTEEELAAEKLSLQESDTPDDTCTVDVKEEVSIVENGTEKTANITADSEAEDTDAIRENKIEAFGAILGKSTKWREMSQEEWVSKRREIRTSEFAPVYDNFKRAGYLKSEDLSQKVSASEADKNNVTNDVDVCTNVGWNAGVSSENSKNRAELRATTDSNVNNMANNANFSVPSNQTNAYQDHLLSNVVDVSSINYDSTMNSQNATGFVNTVAAIDNTTQKFGEVNKIINEDNIMAGLKYLREKFEKDSTT